MSVDIGPPQDITYVFVVAGSHIPKGMPQDLVCSGVACWPPRHDCPYTKGPLQHPLNEQGPQWSSPKAGASQAHSLQARFGTDSEVASTVKLVIGKYFLHGSSPVTDSECLGWHEPPH